MRVRHAVEESNVVKNAKIRDPTKIRHVVIQGGKIESMSGLIDPKSHLNSDFPDHRVNICVIAEKFEIGARIKFGSNGLLLAAVGPDQFGHYGFVDYTKRLSEMITEVSDRMNQQKSDAC